MGTQRNGAVSDEPLTPAGRLFLRPEMNTIIHCVIGVKNSIDVDEVKSLIMNSPLVKHPRFSSLLVKDRHGREHWRKTEIDIHRHVIVINRCLTSANEDSHETGETEELTEENVDDARVVNDYLADLAVSTPLSNDKPLWEIHMLTAQKCAVFRIHHALGDGISLMALLMACCRRADDVAALPSTVSEGKGKRKKTSGGNWGRVLVGFVKTVLFSLVYVIEFVLRGLWVCDRKTAISGGGGVELWPRKMATARFSLDDMKLVKRAVAGATVNDVLFGLLSSGLSRYLDHRTPKGLPRGLQLTGVAMVNLREQPGLQELSDLMKGDSRSRWGNKFGMLLLPVYYHKCGGNPLDYVKRAKAMIDKKKQSLEAYFSYKIGDFVMSWLGPKVACMLNYRIVCNTSFTISNMIGPQEEITVAGTPVTYLRVNTSSLAHALTMHMVSYAGRADMQILVAKDIIPDPEFLAKCFEDALLEMKTVAEQDTQD